MAASSNITISGDVTLCLSGYTLTAPSATGNFITVNNGAGVYVDKTGTLTMNGGAIADNDATGNAGGVYVRSGGTFTIKSGEVNGSIVKASSATITVTGGTFSEDPSDYVAEGYKATETSGTWVVTENS